MKTLEEALVGCKLLYRAVFDSTLEECYIRVNGEQLEILYQPYGEQLDYIWVKTERVHLND